MKNFFKNYWEKLFPERVASKRLRKAMHTPILPSKFGWGMLAALITMFLWSANHQLNLGYALLFIVGTTVLFSAILTTKELADIEVSAKSGNGIFVGERATFWINVSEQRRILINDEAIQYPHPIYQFAEVRGRMYLDTIEVSSIYPFEFFNAWQWVRLDAAVIVYPAPQGTLPLPVAEDAGGIGINLQSAHGDDELSHLRNYVVGDNLAHVAWKQSGRGTGLLFKQFSGVDSVTLTLQWQHTSGSTEERLSQLSKWILEAEELNILYGLQLPNIHIKPNHGAAHKHRCLTALALF